MKPLQTLRSEVQKQAIITIEEKNQCIRPANLIELISNPPALLYASPATGMILFFVSAVSFLLSSFFRTFTR